MKSNSDISNSFTVISGLAHELDSPLKSILTKTRKLITDYKNRNFEYISYKDFNLIIKTLEQLERQLEHCSDTTSRMLYVGKRRAHLEGNQCQINEIINNVTEGLSDQLKAARIKVVMKLGKDLPMVTVGPVEAHQIIHNVVVNAIQAMPGGGNIKIKTLLEADSRFVGIDVLDEGIGITPEHLSKVFEPFFTTKERGIDKSAGLGLSIIYSIINAAGGSVHIKSSLRKGTAVQISLPAFQS